MSSDVHVQIEFPLSNPHRVCEVVVRKYNPEIRFEIQRTHMPSPLYQGGAAARFVCYVVLAVLYLFMLFCYTCYQHVVCRSHSCKNEAHYVHGTAWPIRARWHSFFILQQFGEPACSSRLSGFNRNTATLPQHRRFPFYLICRVLR